MWSSKWATTSKLLQLGINKAELFLKSITLVVKALHFILLISRLRILVQQKQPKPCSCTHLIVINEIHRKIISKMPAEYHHFDNVKKSANKSRKKFFRKKNEYNRVAKKGQKALLH